MINNDFNKVCCLIFKKDTQLLLNVLSENNEEARIVGGAVRNAILKIDIFDIDVATTMTPLLIIKKINKIGFKIINSNIHFGIIKAISNNNVFDITTLKTYYKVNNCYKFVFTKNWYLDARRRDFTINAIYFDKNGKIYDYFRGIEDIKNRIIRFVGCAKKSINQDYKRVIRCFRFYQILPNFKIDANGINAIKKYNNKNIKLYHNNIWNELKKILSFTNPECFFISIIKNNVVNNIFPEYSNCLYIRINILIYLERILLLFPDPILRLENIIQKNIQHAIILINIFELSKLEKIRIINCIKNENITIYSKTLEIKKYIYKNGKKITTDILINNFITSYINALEQNNIFPSIYYYKKIYNIINRWNIPKFPLNGYDIINIGIKKGPEIGKKLKILEKIWINSNFKLNKFFLIKLAYSI